ncbi:MAG: hypothetical protein R3C16_07045 [Hyphomonadaceae bacterium]
MSLADIHVRAERFQSRIGQRNLIEYIAAASVVGVFGWFALTIPLAIAQLGSLLIIAGALYVTWKLRSIAGGQQKDPAVSWADFHRSELMRQRDALRSVWRWYLGPLLPGFLVFVAGVVFAPENPAPLLAKLAMLVSVLGFGAAVFGFIGWINAIGAKRLDQEIAKLDAARR